MLVFVLAVLLLAPNVGAVLTTRDPKQPLDDYFVQLRLLLAEILFTTPVDRCFAVITDGRHQEVFERSVFRRTRLSFFLKIPDWEDLLAPNYQTIRVLKEIRAQNCDLYLILLANGHQMRRFMVFLDDNRVLDSRAKYVLLHDHRILTKDMIYIWRNVVQSVFLRWTTASKDQPRRQFKLLSVHYPSILEGVLSIQELAQWKDGKFGKTINLFEDKTADFKGSSLRTVVFDHIPMVIKAKDGSFQGLEVEIIRALEKTLNFKADFYETKDAEIERWGKILPNRSYTGLLGEMINRRAKLAIGDLHLNILYSRVMDMSTPHSHECLTFLTPESSQDNSWRTLFLPFSGIMWACVLLVQLVVGTVFYVMSFTHTVSIGGCAYRKQNFFSIFRKRAGATINPLLFRDVNFRSSLNRRLPRRGSTDIFDDFTNCILLTYSMSVYVALPRMPKNWPLRVLTGWYWMYCIMIVVFYRASFTAILANPAPRITIDTIEELANSRITTSAWGTENRKFFRDAFDANVQEIGERLELVDDIYGVTDLIAKGHYAYYDNQFFLRHLRLLGSQRREDDEILHIMSDCVVNMPISIGMEKNSPLKPNVDKYIVWMKEAGLISKWQKDATKDLSSEEEAPQEAVMNLKKFWSSFVALGCGYFLSLLTIVSERLHFKYIVQRHPLYDRYNPRMYYNFQRRYN